MKIVSTNIGQATSVSWRGKEIQTGIYKYPTSSPIHLGVEDVADDSVVDRKHHGGTYKACYLFSSDYYPDWKKRYPELNWSWGMFGENLTVAGLDENQLHVGDVFQLGDAIVQVTEPRQPCYKLGIKFGTQEVLKEFIDFGHPGTYVRIVKEGTVSVGDTMERIETSPHPLSIHQFNQLINRQSTNPDWIKQLLANDAVREEKKERFKKFV